VPTTLEKREAWNACVRLLAELYTGWQEAAFLIDKLIEAGLSNIRSIAYVQVRTNPKITLDYLLLLRLIGDLGDIAKERLERLFISSQGAAFYRRSEVSIRAV
jgi:hypothetical protein